MYFAFKMLKIELSGQTAYQPKEMDGIHTMQKIAKNT